MPKLSHLFWIFVVFVEIFQALRAAYIGADQTQYALVGLAALAVHDILKALDRKS